MLRSTPNPLHRVHHHDLAVQQPLPPEQDLLGLGVRGRRQGPHDHAAPQRQPASVLVGDHDAVGQPVVGRQVAAGNQQAS